ncbi:MAG: outer membrane protein assembly factor BamA [Pseudomonadales bacterium]|nr:outer membrane protein assembly factor BamA [Halioglobus sp.]MCP5131669.1 outer membrane protein assembly factor BamA [Pseudomonadales bacterium]
MKRITIFFALALVLLAPLASAETFIIADIRVEGLQRVSAGSVFAALPVAVGDVVDEQTMRSAARSLFATGNFDDIQVGRDGNVLVVVVVERPSISEINIEGNKAIETEALLDGLKGAGLAVGQVFQRSTLEGMQLELQRQYVQQGRYDANIETEVIPEPRNRVTININVDEGTVAAIKHINVVGNQAFSDQEIADLFELQTTGWLSFFSNDDKYSKEKLTGDLEKLTSYYMDRGYLEFTIDSTQVSVSPDLSEVYITANVTEGEIFTISSVDLSGDLVLPEADLKRFVLVTEGQIFSQQLVTGTEEYMTRRLGNDGYNFAKVTGIPEVNKEDNTVAMKFFVDPGKRTYVRRINFNGNLKTADDVLRREMRQMEAAPASAANIEQSRVRLERLGFFSKATVETKEVPGHDDLIDADFTVEEQSSGSIGASIGYAQDAGIILGLNVQQDNFLGTGKRIGLGLNRSKYQDLYNFSYTNPYYTVDGVSRGFNIYYRSTDLSEVNIASYSTNTLGGNLNFGYPIKETQRLGFSFGVANTDVTAGRYAVQEIKGSPRLQSSVKDWYVNTLQPDGTYSEVEVIQPIDTLPPEYEIEPREQGFLDENGNDYLNYTVTSSWSQSTLNRGRMATRGASNVLALEVSVPASDLEFFKLTYNGEIYFPVPLLSPSWTLRLHTELGYGDGWGDTKGLPFYENFFAGGFGSVRGYQSNTLGPRSTPALPYSVAQPVTKIDEDGNPLEYGGPKGDEFGYVYLPSAGKLAVQLPNHNGDPFGGNVLMVGGAELIFPLPFLKDQNSVRTAFFMDAGNVFSTDCGSTQLNCYNVDFNELRYSVGVGLTWITGFGPLTFSLAKPFNEDEYDQDEVFQFTLGRGF